MEDSINEMKRKSEGFWRSSWRRFRKSKLGMIGLFLVLLLIGTGLLAPVLANDQPIMCRFKGEIHAPGLVELTWNIPFAKHVIKKSFPFDQAGFRFRKRFEREKEEGDWAWLPPVPYHPNGTSTNVLQPATTEHFIGTDEVGRDLAARMIYGARVSMLVGFVSVGISTIIGLFLGCLAGYFGGIVDVLISRLIEIVLCFPVFFLIVSIVVWRPPSIWNVMIVIGLVRWTGTARYVRGELIRLRDSEYALAARALGASSARVIFRHLLPNSLAPIFVTVTFGIAAAIAVEASLSWLGFGVQPPQASWGNILKQAYVNIQTAPHMIFPPCIAIFIAVLSYNLVGDTLRDAVDPRVAKS